MLLPLARDGAGGKGEVWGWGVGVRLAGEEESALVKEGENWKRITTQYREEQQLVQHFLSHHRRKTIYRFCLGGF